MRRADGSPRARQASRRGGPPEHYREAILRISEALGRTLDLHTILRKILQTTSCTLKSDRGSILLLDQPGDRLQMLASRGLPRKVVRHGYIPRKGGIAEWVLAHNQPIILGKSFRSRRFSSIATERRLLSSMCAPLRIKGKSIGVINVSRTKHHKPFTRRDLEMLVIMGSQAAISIENARLHEQQLRAQRLAMVGQIVAEIGHGVKNTLMLVRGGASLCESAIKTHNWEQIDAAMAILKSGVNRLGLTVADLLDYSKDREPDLEPVNLAQMIQQVCDAVSHSASAKSVSVVRDVSPEAREIISDENYIYRSILNLVLNALDAVPQGGMIALSAAQIPPDHPLVRAALPPGRKSVSRKDRVGQVGGERELALRNEYVLIRVEDTGCGVERENLEKIFDPFFSTKAGRGTGLGLAVTKKFVERLDGAISVESTIGKGTTFSIILPT
jgi:signal transduction histidine kinase